MASEEVLQECRERQEDEIVALESIFAPPGDDIEQTENAGHRLAEPRVKLIQRDPEPIIELYLPITLPRPTRIAVDTFVQEADSQQAQASSSKLTDDPQIHAEVQQSNGAARQGLDLSAQGKAKQPDERNHRYRHEPRNLSAAANAFQPRAPSSDPQQSSSASPRSRQNGSGNINEDVAALLGTLGLDKPPKSAAAAPTNGIAKSRQLRSTKLLPSLSHLAPITLRVRLPPTYPAERPPIVDALTAPWLSTLEDRQDKSLSWILEKLDEQYRELGGMEALYIWATCLSESLWSELLDDPATSSDDGLPSDPPFLHRDTSANSVGLRFEEHLTSPEDPPRLAAQLLAHSRLCSRTTFDASSFDCAICLETRKGRACVQLTGCGHVFCSECLAGYLSSLVDDGFHRQAKRCPDPECVTLWSEREKQNLVDQEGNLIPPARIKGNPAPSPDPAAVSSSSTDEAPVVVGLVTRPELELILGPTRLARLDELTVKAKMEADPSVSYCPRSGCQAPVVRLSSDENSGHWERFRECLSCGFAFCAWCSRSWHGPSSCPVSFQSSLMRQYLSLPPTSPERTVMEQKFGRKTLETMVRKYLEEQQTNAYLKDHTTPCPTCGISIEKSYGCNHMTCKQCNTHYCYLCGKSISSQNPYLHFNSPGYECYQRLFDGLLGDQGQRRVVNGEEGEDGEDGGGVEEGAGERRGGGADGDARPRFALLLDENGIPLHLEPEDEEADFLAWQQFH